MSLWNEPKITAITAYSRNLSQAMDDVQSAKNCGDENALGYAEGRVLRWKRELAKLDPRGYGKAHLGTLTTAERLEVEKMIAQPVHPSADTRQSKESVQRATMAAKFAGKNRAATADFDLPAPNDNIAQPVQPASVADLKKI